MTSYEVSRSEENIQALISWWFHNTRRARCLPSQIGWNFNGTGVLEQLRKADVYALVLNREAIHRYGQWMKEEDIDHDAGGTDYLNEIQNPSGESV